MLYIISDNDECALHMCDHLGPGYKCRNTLGFFRCDKIAAPITTPKPSDSSTVPGPGYTTISRTFLKCPRGYYLGPDKQCLGKWGFYNSEQSIKYKNDVLKQIYYF